MSFGAGIALWVFALAVTVAFFALAAREFLVLRRLEGRVEAWRKAGRAREAGEVLIEGAVWSDEQGPVARVPVFVFGFLRADPTTGGGIIEQQTGLAVSRPFWLATDEGDVAIDAHPDVAEVEVHAGNQAILGSAVHDVVVGERVEVFGRLGKEHIAGATEGFRDGDRSAAIHGDRQNPIHLAPAGTIARTLWLRRLFTNVALVAALLGAVISQASLFHYQLRLLDGRVVRATLTARDRDGDDCKLTGIYRSGGKRYWIWGRADASVCDAAPKTMPFLLCDQDPTHNNEAGADAHPDRDAVETSLTIQLTMALVLLGAGAVLRRRFPA